MQPQHRPLRKIRRGMCEGYLNLYSTWTHRSFVGTPVGLLAFEGTISGVPTVSAALGIGLAADEAEIESSHAEYRFNNQ